MSDQERDTHFQGFAELLWEEIADKLIEVASLDPESAPSRERWIQIRQDVLTLIAQRAYDFSEHVLSEAPMTEYSTDSTYITDLIAWSEASSG